MRIVLEIFQRKDFLLLFKVYASVVLSALYALLEHTKWLTSRVHKLLFLVVASEGILAVFLDYKRIILIHCPIFITYAGTCIFRDKPYMPWVLVVTNMIYLSVFQIQEFIIPLDQQAWVMQKALLWALRILTQQMISYAWDVHDMGNEAKAQQSIGFLELLAYSIYFPTLMTGPTIKYVEFQDLLNRREPPAESGRIPRVVRLLLKTHILLAVVIYVRPYFAVSWLPSPWFEQQDFFARCFFVLIAAIFARDSMYAGWKGAEASFVMIGMGLCRHGSDFSWSGMENVDILTFERSPSMIVSSSSWNKKTYIWLGDNFYRRLKAIPGLRSHGVFCKFATFMVSAIWHGFFPGYFMFFSTYAWLTIVTHSKQSR